MAAMLDSFRALIENSTDAIFLVNARTEIMYASPSTVKILGYQPEELLGRNGLELVHPQDREHSSEALKEVIAKPHSPLQMHARVRRKDGEWRWIESTASNLLHEPFVQAIVLNSREISARRRQYDEHARRCLAIHRLVGDFRNVIRCCYEWTYLNRHYLTGFSVGFLCKFVSLIRVLQRAF